MERGRVWCLGWVLWVVCAGWARSGHGEVSVAWGSLDPPCRWHIHVSVYWSTRICAHLGCTQCSEWLHLTDICFLFISLWQVLQIQNCLRWTWICQKKNNRNGPPLLGVGGVGTICTACTVTVQPRVGCTFLRNKHPGNAKYYDYNINCLLHSPHHKHS